MLKRLWITLSNLAYPVAALLISGEPVFVMLMTALGAGSAFWHYNRTRLGANLDVGMIFVILLFLTGIGWGVAPLVAVLPAIAGGVVLRLYVPYLKMEEKVIILMVPILVFGVLSGASLFFATVVLLVALIIRNGIDHGLWHPVSAAGLSLLAVALAS